MGLLTIIFHLLGIKSFGTILGLVSLSIEAIVAFPQMVQNQKNKSVEGLSLFMIFTWFLGDFLKTIYFVLKVNSPNIYRISPSNSSSAEHFSLQLIH